MKVVINKCYGGFGLSEAAYEKLIEWGVPVCAYDKDNDRNDEKVIFDNSLSDPKDSFSTGRYWDGWTREYANRSDALVVRVVEELGAAASDSLASLEVVEIPDDIDFEIEDYDGIESIHEHHRSW